MLTELKRARNTYLTNENIARDTMLVETADTFINALSTGIEKYGIVNHPIYGKVYAYEVDGYGSATFMDDANIPSLLSIPDLGYTKLMMKFIKTLENDSFETGESILFERSFFEGLEDLILVLEMLGQCHYL